MLVDRCYIKSKGSVSFTEQNIIQQTLFLATKISASFELYVPYFLVFYIMYLAISYLILFN